MTPHRHPTARPDQAVPGGTRTASAERMELELLRRTPRFTLSIWGRVSVTAWHAPAQVVDFDDMERLLLFQAAMRGPLASVALVERIDVKTPPELRERIIRYAAKLQPVLPWTALVLRCDGLAAIAMYAVLNAVNLLSGAKNPPHVSRALDKG